jgi:N-acetylglucosamine kinase-like BadF-type ATPase
MHLGLGLDVGGTKCRWALVNSQGQLLQEGHTGSFNGQQVHTEEGRRHIYQQMAAIRAALQGVQQQVPDSHASVAVWAGITGYDGPGAEGGEGSGPTPGGDQSPGDEGSTSLRAQLAHGLGVSGPAVSLYNDVELAHRVSLAPGEGHLVYAGTGCIATFLDSTGRLHRVGGRGETLGDDGSGYWIGCQALKAIWRAEDEQPGFIQQSPLAKALFQAVGGARWEDTRSYMLLASRGDVGRLALAVGAVADHDDLARRVIVQAGEELARLAQLLIRHHGLHPVGYTGGAFDLHPSLAETMVNRLPVHAVVRRLKIAAHRGAALKAAGAVIVGP